LGIGHIVLRCKWANWTGHDFPINSQWVFLITILFSVLVYVGVSWLEVGKAFNMDKILHRGPYAEAGERLPDLRPTRWWHTIFGITPMFSRRDRLSAFVVVGYFLLWLGVFVSGTIYGWVADPGEAAWARFWLVYLCLGFAQLVIGTLWLGLGGCRDLGSLLRDLRKAERDFTDDGSIRTIVPTPPTTLPPAAGEKPIAALPSLRDSVPS